MKIPFLKQLQRLTGPAAQEVQVAAAGPAREPLERAVRHLLGELPDLLLAAVVDVGTGKPLAAYAAEPSLRPAAVAGFNAEAVRQVQASLRAMGATAERLEEMLFTLPSQLHLLHLAPSGQVFVYLAVDSRDTNLGIARAVMRGAIGLVEPAATATTE